MHTHTANAPGLLRNTPGGMINQHATQYMNACTVCVTIIVVVIVVVVVRAAARDNEHFARTLDEDTYFSKTGSVIEDAIRDMADVSDDSYGAQQRQSWTRNDIDNYRDAFFGFANDINQRSDPYDYGDDPVDRINRNRKHGMNPLTSHIGTTIADYYNNILKID